MGKLKSLTFQAETDDGKRLVKTTLESISSDKAPTTIRQLPDKAPIMFPDKKSNETQIENDFEEILTTCENNHVISKQGNKNTRVSLLATNTSHEDTNEWLIGCDELF
jgi:maltodextrin utilization protein YvdJ